MHPTCSRGKRFLAMPFQPLLKKKMPAGSESQIGLRLTALSTIARCPSYSMRGNHSSTVFNQKVSNLGPGSYHISSSFKSKSEYTVPRLYFGSGERSWVWIDCLMCKHKLVKNEEARAGSWQLQSGHACTKP